MDDTSSKDVEEVMDIFGPSNGEATAPEDATSSSIATSLSSSSHSSVIVNV